MELRMVREFTNDQCTISRLYINNKYFCDILEDVDRMLDSSMSLEEIAKIKIKGKTAIPVGTYTIVITYSPRFKQYMPLLMNVPGYAGIRIHPGNTHVDTDGCLLPGVQKETTTVVNSRATYKSLLAKLKAVEKKEKITITIVRKY